MFSKVKIVFFILMILSITLSCEKKEKYPLPNVNVEVVILLDNPDITTPGKSKIISGGINGIIVYCADVDKYKAFEITCPHEAEKRCKVEVEGGIAKCPCCKSKYSLDLGSVYEGPSKWPLKPYSAKKYGNKLFITN